MKTLFFVSALSLAALFFAATPATAEVKDVPQPVQPGQIPPAPPPGPPLDPAKLAEYQKRFEQGYELQKQGKLTEARAIYDSILAEQPDAKRSLLEAGRISLKLNQPDKADVYLSKLQTLVPDFPEVYELLIQANTALKRDIKVNLLIKQFQTLHSQTQDPHFAQSPSFVREVVQLDNGESINFLQYFDYTKDRNYAWEALYMGKDGIVKRKLDLFYDFKAAPEGQAAAAAPQKSQFILAEEILKDGKVDRVDAYFQMFTLPEYKKVRASMLAILAGAYKPVYSQQIGETPAPTPAQ